MRLGYGFGFESNQFKKGIIMIWNGLKGKRVLRRQKGPKGNKKKGRRASMVNNQDKIIALLGGSGPTSKTAQNSALSFPLFPIFNPHFSPLLASMLSAYLLCYFHAPLLNRCFPSSFITPVTHFPHNQRLSSHCLSSPLHSLFQLSVFVSPYWMLG